jgi:hypothetical protein
VVIGDAGASTNSEVELGLLAIHTLVAGGGNEKRGPGDVVRNLVCNSRRNRFNRAESGLLRPCGSRRPVPPVGQWSGPFHASTRSLLRRELFSRSVLCPWREYSAASGPVSGRNRAVQPDPGPLHPRQPDRSWAMSAVPPPRPEPGQTP